MNTLFKITFVLILLAALPVQVAQGCGPGDYRFKGFSFLNPKIAETETPLAGFLMRFDQLYSSFNQVDSVQENTNLKEWEAIFCNQAKVKDIREIVYGSVDNLQEIKTAIGDKKTKLRLRLSKNSFARHLVKYKCQETVDYLLFAKSCEPHVTHSQDYWSEIKRNSAAMQNLIDEGQRVFSRTKSNTIKLRYAYQLIRLAHYAGDYQGALELYDNLLPKIDPVASIMYEWILAHKAGALKAMGNRVEAAYLFSLVFDKSKAKRTAAFQSFSLKSAEEWQQCFLLCQSDRERAMLYVLRASERDSKPVNDMRAIYELNPQNENLELLLVKEIKKLEKDFLGTEFNRYREENKKRYNIPGKYAAQRLVDLTQFAIDCAAEKKVARPQVWKLAQGYLLYLSNDLYAANQVFAQLSGTLDDKALEKQLEVFQLVSQITGYQDIDEAKEQAIMEIIRDNEWYQELPDLQGFINDKLAYEYTKDGHPGKAFRCHYPLRALKPNPQKEIIEDLLKVATDKDRTKFEKVLTTNKDHTEMVYELMDMKGTYYFSNDQPEAALATFKQIPLIERQKKRFNPFIEQAETCVNCTLPDSLLIYDKASLLERIFELEFKAKSDYLNSDKYNYDLGVAYFNMSYFGYSWKAIDYFRSGANWYASRLDYFEHWYFPFGNKEHQDLSKAKFYFQRVLELSENRERAARAAYWLARCDLLTYLTSKESDYLPGGNRIPILPPEFMLNYNLLAENYAETKFYKWAIQECAFFRAYSTK